MPRKSFAPERIIAKLCQVEVLLGQGMAGIDGMRQKCPK